MTMRLFKVACLSYAASDVNYREHNLTRGQLISLRRQLLDRVTESMIETKLFKANSFYPRRHFDDLLMEAKKAEQHTISHHDNTLKGLTGSQAKLKQMLAQKLPFGVISGKESRLNLQQSKASLTTHNPRSASKRMKSALNTQIETDFDPNEIIQRNSSNQNSKLDVAPRNIAFFSPRGLEQPPQFVNDDESIQNGGWMPVRQPITSKLRKQVHPPTIVKQLAH